MTPDTDISEPRNWLYHSLSFPAWALHLPYIRFAVEDTLTRMKQSAKVGPDGELENLVAADPDTPGSFIVKPSLSLREMEPDTSLSITNYVVTACARMKSAEDPFLLIIEDLQAKAIPYDSFMLPMPMRDYVHRPRDHDDGVICRVSGFASINIESLPFAGIAVLPPETLLEMLVGGEQARLEEHLAAVVASNAKVVGIEHAGAVDIGLDGLGMVREALYHAALGQEAIEEIAHIAEQFPMAIASFSHQTEPADQGEALIATLDELMCALIVRPHAGSTEILLELINRGLKLDEGAAERVETLVREVGSRNSEIEYCPEIVNVITAICARAMAQNLAQELGVSTFRIGSPRALL